MITQPHENSKQGYHKWSDDAEASGATFEVFWADAGAYNGEAEAGWYWHACFAGCLPDGEPVGPFATSQDAFNDARRFD